MKETERKFGNAKRDMENKRFVARWPCSGDISNWICHPTLVSLFVTLKIVSPPFFTVRTKWETIMETRENAQNG